MPKLNYYIANSAGKLDGLTDKIIQSFEKAKKITEKELNANQIDMIFVPTLFPLNDMDGISGSSRGPNILYVWINPDHKNITEEQILLSLLHETHHCMRQRKYPYGKNLGETIVYEGMATLYEEQHGIKTPKYALAKIKDEEISIARKQFKDENFDHQKWFFGSSKITHWFGYTYGYRLCKKYSVSAGKKASELVNVDPKLILDQEL